MSPRNPIYVALCLGNYQKLQKDEGNSDTLSEHNNNNKYDRNHVNTIMYNSACTGLNNPSMHCVCLIIHLLRIANVGDI